MLFYYYKKRHEGLDAMHEYTPYLIKSFKHDGHLHRMWLQNWLVPESQLLPEHRLEAMMVFINSQTKIQEADGKEWTSRIPGVSFFIPGEWFNVVALLEEQGVRYYCNVASPPYTAGRVLTYIDYDLDVIRLPGGEVHVVDQEEYERHRVAYHYSEAVHSKVQAGLQALLQRIADGGAPFRDEWVLNCYERWKRSHGGGAQ
jgi:protein associated with RNAse G/E